MGDTGTGKSTLIRRILLQIEERGETAIVYDPALDYTPEFYRARAWRCDSQSARCSGCPTGVQAMSCGTRQRHSP